MTDFQNTSNETIVSLSQLSSLIHRIFSMEDQLLEELKSSLKIDRSDPSRKYWARQIVDKDIPLLDLAPLLDAEHPVGMRFTWLIGDIMALEVQRGFPAIPYFFSRRHDITFPGYKRTLAKMMCNAGIPEEIEGEAVDEMFKWIRDPKVKVAVKAYSLDALYNFCVKYPELKEELKLVIEEQMEHHSFAFKKRAKRILKKL